MNALVHGGRSESTRALPGEDQALLDQKVQSTIDDLRAETPLECELAEEVALCQWRVKRGMIAEDAHVTQMLHDLDDGFEKVQAQEVVRLIEQLDEQPSIVMPELRDRSQGLVWALDQLSEIRQRLEHFQNVTPEQRRRVVCLMGKKPSSLFDDTLVWLWHRSYAAANSGACEITVEGVSGWLSKDRPEGMKQGAFERQVKDLIADLPDRLTGKATLIEMIDSLLAELTTQLEWVEKREARTRDLILKQKVDVSPTGVRLVGYTMRHRGARDSALRRLEALKKERQGGAASAGSKRTPAPSPPPTADAGMTFKANSDGNGSAICADSVDRGQPGEESGVTPGSGAAVDIEMTFKANSDGNGSADSADLADRNEPGPESAARPGSGSLGTERTIQALSNPSLSPQPPAPNPGNLDLTVKAKSNGAGRSGPDDEGRPGPVSPDPNPVQPIPKWSPDPARDRARRQDGDRGQHPRAP